MNTYITAILLAAGAGILFLLWILYEKRKRKKMILKKIQRIYGQIPEREYSPGDLEQISHYFQRKKTGFYIDDITWNDLDMDKIYMLVNQTMSSPGEDVLYSAMRTPVFDRDIIEKREKLICFFADNKDKREKMQLLLSDVGKTWHGSLSDTILALEDAPLVSTRLHWGMLAALLFSLIILMPAVPLYGFLLLIILSSLNVVIYYTGKDKMKIEAYLDCFGSLLRMLSLAAQADTVNWPETAEQMEKIRRGRYAFRFIKKRTFLLTNKNNSTGDPSQLLLDYFRMVFHLDILVYNSVLKEVKGKSKEIMELLDGWGELDAAISIASFREILPLWSRPEFVEPGAGHIRLTAENLYHPLLREPVANSITADTGILVTGSNASGKSTFLKNVAINSILAQTIFTCPCSVYRAPFLKVMTSMALRDDLSGGESYFIVEIKSLKRILNESDKREPLLCIIDEVLRGTNTIERIAASSRILNALNKRWILPIAATHDIELSYILEKQYTNYHFEEEVLENQVVFPYLLQPGRTVARNALRLLKILGFDSEIVETATQAAADFEEKGVWKTIEKNGLQIK